MYVKNAKQRQFRESALARSVEFPDAGTWGKPLLLLSLLAWGGGYAWSLHTDAFTGFKASLAVLTIIGLLLGVRGLADPIPGILGVGMLCTLDPVSRVYLLTGGLWRWNTFNYFFLLVILLSLRYYARLRDVHTHLLLWLIAWLAIGWVVSPDKLTGAYNILGALAYFGLLRFWGRVGERDDTWYWTALVSAVVAAGGGLVYYQLAPRLPYINRNAWSFFPLAAMFTSALALHYVRERRRQGLLAVLALLSLIWVYLSGSRGGLLLGLSASLAILLQMRGLSTRWVVAAGSILISVVLFSYFSDQYTYAVLRLQKVFDPYSTWFDRTSGRTDMLIGAWYIFLRQPLGIGTGGFAPAFADVTTLATYGGEYWGTAVHKAAHAAWAKVLAENGLPGIVLLSGFVLSFAWSGWKRKKQNCWTVAIFASATLALAFFWTEFASKGVWWLASGAATVLNPEHARDVLPPVRGTSMHTRA